MADIRINALATTATTPASDDYLALDGTAQGTRKILATNIANNVTDVILGSSGPSVKSSLSARAPRQGLVFDGTAGATFTEQNTSISHTVRFVFNSTFDTTGRRYVAWKSASYGMGVSSSTEGRKLFVEGSIFALGNTSLVAGKNYDCVFVYNGSTVTFYLNGIADGTTAAITTNNISRILDTNQSGSVSGFLIYNRALSASEVVSLYEAGAPAGADYNSASNTAINTSAFTNNGTFGLNYSTFSGASATGFTAAQATATAGMAEMKPNLSAKVGKRYRVSFTATLTSGQAPTFQTQDGSGNQCFPQVTVTNGANSFEVTMNSFASGTLVTSFYTSNVTSYAISSFSMVPLGLLLAPDAAQAGGGLTWYDTSGNAANITLPASGVSWNVPSSRVLGGNWTTSGNLTVSGTGQSAFSGNLSATGEISCNGSGGALRADSRTGSGLNWYIYNPTGADLRFYNSTGGNVVNFTNGGNVLIGTTTDSANGKLQLATHTTSAGGIGLGTATSIWTAGSGSLRFGDSTNTAQIAISGSGVYIGASAGASGNTILTSGSGATALTLDSSQRAQFAATTDSTSTTTGALTVAGGVGIAKKLYVGDSITTAGSNAALFFNSRTGANSNYAWYSPDGTVARLYDNTNAKTLVDVAANTGNATFAGTITTAAPTSGTAKAWKLGEVATVSPTSPNRTIRVEIDGTVYYISAKTTND